MNRLHSKEDILDIVINTPGLGYFEGNTIIAIELNRVSDDRLFDILGYIESESLDYESFDNLVFLSESLAGPHIINILFYIQAKLKSWT